MKNEKNNIFSPNNFHFSGLANDNSLNTSEVLGIPLLDACCIEPETAVENVFVLEACRNCFDKAPLIGLSLIHI